MYKISTEAKPLAYSCKVTSISSRPEAIHLKKKRSEFVWEITKMCPLLVTLAVPFGTAAYLYYEKRTTEQGERVLLQSDQRDLRHVYSLTRRQKFWGLIRI